jgi:hemerythrin-like domain-containing protein
MDAIDQLYEDHERILEALDTLEALTEFAVTQRTLDRGDALTLVSFFRTFLDEAHHGKEEQVLFPALEAVGFSPHFGPVAVMLAEHDEGRTLLRATETAAESLDVASFFGAARAYSSLLRQHIEKENQILFPMSRARLGAGRLSAIEGDFARVEAAALANRTRDDWIARIRDIAARVQVGASALG